MYTDRFYGFSFVIDWYEADLHEWKVNKKECKAADIALSVPASHSTYSKPSCSTRCAHDALCEPHLPATTHSLRKAFSLTYLVIATVPSSDFAHI